MEEYLEDYGRHFNKKLYEYAVGMMKDRNGQPLKAWDKEKIETFMKSSGIAVKNNYGYDAAYVFNMGRADYLGSSVIDDLHLALFDDPDGSPSRAFDEFYIKQVGLGIPIFWDEML